MGIFSEITFPTKGNNDTTCSPRRKFSEFLRVRNSSHSPRWEFFSKSLSPRREITTPRVPHEGNFPNSSELGILRIPHDGNFFRNHFSHEGK
ncbi:hypothetical protein LguiA_011278 [Lonicera macranthoides]